MAQAGAQREPSMEEILASIRRIIENNETAGAPADLQDEADESAAGIDDDLMHETAAEELRQVLMEDDGELDETPADGIDEEPVAAPTMETVTPMPSANVPAPAGDQPGTGLVSSDTGHKVAAAFAELNAAIEAGKARSFDEIAEEMLRPMLTQWLDDNLPTLVERLVREEIERVSRGNRR